MVQKVDGAVVRAKDIPKVIRLQDYGFKLKSRLLPDGRTYISVLVDPRNK